MDITVFTLPICPNCDNLKEKLTINNLQFNTEDLEDEDVRMNLLIDSVTLIEAPIVRIDGSYMDATSALKVLGIYA